VSAVLARAPSASGAMFGAFDGRARDCVFQAAVVERHFRKPAKAASDKRGGRRLYRLLFAEVYAARIFETLSRVDSRDSFVRRPSRSGPNEEFEDRANRIRSCAGEEAAFDAKVFDERREFCLASDCPRIGIGGLERGECGEFVSKTETRSRWRGALKFVRFFSVLV